MSSRLQGHCSAHVFSTYVEWVGAPPATTGGGRRPTIGACPSSPSHRPLLRPFCPHLSHSLARPRPQETSPTDVSNSIDPGAHRTGWKLPPQQRGTVPPTLVGRKRLQIKTTERTVGSVHGHHRRAGQGGGGGVQTLHITRSSVWTQPSIKTHRARFHGSLFPATSGGVEAISSPPGRALFMMGKTPSPLATLLFYFDLHLLIFYSVPVQLGVLSLL